MLDFTRLRVFKLIFAVKRFLQFEIDNQIKKNNHFLMEDVGTSMRLFLAQKFRNVFVMLKTVETKITITMTQNRVLFLSLLVLFFLHCKLVLKSRLECRKC